MKATQSRMITFPADRHTTPGFLVTPDENGPHPALVAIQEWWGLVPHIRDVAERFARAGFTVLAPDLYHGETASEPDEARKLAMTLDRDRAVDEILAAVAYLESRATPGPPGVGVVGWCLGGGLALSAAAESDAIDAVVCFYGQPLAEEDTDRLKAPVLGLFGEDDHGIPAERVREFAGRLDQLEIPHNIKIYEGAGHAFFNDTRPSTYDEEAASDAWERTLNWFRRYLEK